MNCDKGEVQQRWNSIPTAFDANATATSLPVRFIPTGAIIVPGITGVSYFSIQHEDIDSTLICLIFIFRQTPMFTPLSTVLRKYSRSKVLVP